LQKIIDRRKKQQAAIADTQAQANKLQSQFGNIMNQVDNIQDLANPQPQPQEAVQQ
jgi:uncharacterized protein YggE